MARNSALVLGGGPTLHADLAAIGGIAAWSGLVVATNHTAFTFARVDFAATLHPESIMEWIRNREAAGHPAIPWFTHRRDEGVSAVVWRSDGERWTGGSSGLFAAGVARWPLRCGSVYLAGIALEDGPNLYGTNHTDYCRFRDAWQHAHAAGLLDGVMSLAPPGTFTRDLLGGPDGGP